MSIETAGLGELGGEALHRAPLLMSVADAKHMLCVGHTKIYELIGAGEIEAVKIGAKTCIVVASAVAFVERLRDAAKARGKAAEAVAFPTTTGALHPASERRP
jgi:hypothetical protein